MSSGSERAAAQPGLEPALRGAAARPPPADAVRAAGRSSEERSRQGPQDRALTVRKKRKQVTCYRLF